MPLPILKLAEVMARALFTVGAIFLLPAREGGQFGLVVTLVSLFAFAFGWERHIDIQRRFSGMPAHVVDMAASSLPRLWLTNYALMAPALFALVLVLGRLEVEWAVLVLVIAISEQHSNIAYNLAVMERRYGTLVAISTVRAMVLMLALASLWLFGPHPLQLGALLIVWAVTGLAASLCMMAAWLRFRMHHPTDKVVAAPAIIRGVFMQYRASAYHFAIGGLAVVSIQLDRLVIGSVLPLDQVGIYFRHLLVVSFIYQFFNVASYNRQVATIFALAREGSLQLAHKIIWRERVRVGAICCAGVAAMVLSKFTWVDLVFAQYEISVMLMTILIVGANLRIFADFEALLLNAAFRERRLLTNQIVNLVPGGAALTVLTITYGITGTALGMMGTSATYFALNKFANARSDARDTI